jgi:hypothetical protein
MAFKADDFKTHDSSFQASIDSHHLNGLLNIPASPH